MELQLESPPQQLHTPDNIPPQLHTPDNMEHNSNLFADADFFCVPCINFFGLPGYASTRPPVFPESLRVSVVERKLEELRLEKQLNEAGANEGAGSGSEEALLGGRRGGRGAGDERGMGAVRRAGGGPRPSSVFACESCLHVKRDEVETELCVGEEGEKTNPQILAGAAPSLRSEQPVRNEGSEQPSASSAKPHAMERDRRGLSSEGRVGA